MAGVGLDEKGGMREGLACTEVGVHAEEAARPQQ